jgi:hypothetical protein
VHCIVTRHLPTAFLMIAVACSSAAAANWTLVGWNNLGMHCMDGDYSVLSLLPPYNTINAQLIDPQGVLVTDPQGQGITVTYEATPDPDGSINTTSQGKTNFWDFVQGLFGSALPVDEGLTGVLMPGAANTPQPMTWDPGSSWFIAEGIPLTPYDDAHNKNTYPLMRLTARDAQHAVLATLDVVLPVSDEMDCKSCHSSTSGPAAMPSGGWVTDPNPQREFRLNILKLHDEKQAADPLFQQALAFYQYDAAGLYATATAATPRAILCASCHRSEALPTSGYPPPPAQPTIEPLTRAIHGHHASVIDPLTGLSLDAADDRSACYRCHPGSVTRCLRGVMGAAVAPDGTLAMQCQSCHGAMSDVGSPARTGWLDEPSCQNCHTGTATQNNGQIRFLSVFDTPGHQRVAVDATFATNANTPLPGKSLYRFSSGHGGLKCEACHGSTHAEFPAAHRNDNIQSIEHQGHVGMFVECDACHGSQPNTVNGGPHGMHPVGQAWVQAHGDAVGEGGNASQCTTCHGADYRGTVLSRAKGDRTLSGEFGSKQVWRGFQIGCYTCHRGPGNSDPNPNRPAVVTDATVATPVDTPISVTLQAHDPDGNPLTLRIVSQPAQGTVGLSGSLATYIPAPGFQGADPFTFAAWDGSTDSNLGTVTVNVGSGGGTTTTTLPGGPGPDLTGHWVSLSQKCAGTGDRLRCTVRGKFTVVNQGTVRAGRSRLAFVLDGATLKQQKVGKLKPGRSATKRFSAILRGQSASGKVVIAMVDATNAVAESNESNNTVPSSPIP